MGASGGKGGQQGPFSYGPSQFDLQAIMNALGMNEQAMTNRYDQLGLGGSTMLQQDLNQAGLQAQAATGQEQTSSVQSAATNPALQPPSQVPNQALGALGSLGTDLGKLAGVTSTPNTGGAVAGLGQ